VSIFHALSLSVIFLTFGSLTGTPSLRMQSQSTPMLSTHTRSRSLGGSFPPGDTCPSNDAAANSTTATRHSTTPGIWLCSWGLIWQVPNAAASVFKPGPFAFTLPLNAPKLPTPWPPTAPPALPRPMWMRVRCVLNRGARSASTVTWLGPLLPQKPTKAWPRAVDKSIATAAGGAAVLGTNANARELVAEASAYDVVAVFVEQ